MGVESQSPGHPAAYLSKRLGKNFTVDVGQETTNGCGPDDQDRDADETIEVYEVAAERFLWDLLLIPVPDEDLLAHLHEEPTAGADDLQRRLGIQWMPGHVVGGVGNLFLREKLPRLGAGGSPVSVVEPYGLHSHPGNRTALWPGGPEGWNGWSKSTYRS